MNTLEEIFSKQLIKLIPDIYAAICTGKIKDKSRKITKLPQLQQWLNFYRNSKSIFFISVLNMLSTTGRCSLLLEQMCLYLLPQKERNDILYETLNEISSYSIEEKIKFQSEVADYNQRLKQESDALFNENYENVSRDQAISFISESEIQFFLKVIIPCFVLYGKFPSQLLRKARLGDEKSIKQLVQIDHSIIHDKKISQYIHNLSFRNPTRHKLLIRVLVKDHPKPKEKDLKVDAAALISLFNDLFSKVLKTKKMTAPQIRQLFVDDTDLPVAETFYKSIKRNTMWDDLLKLPDKY